MLDEGIGLAILRVGRAITGLMFPALAFRDAGRGSVDGERMSAVSGAGRWRVDIWTPGNVVGFATSSRCIERKMSRRLLPRWMELRFLRDEELSAELRRFDPYDLMGYIALVAMLSNVVVSIVVPYRTYDNLHSVALVLGILSFLNRGRPLSGAVVVIAIAHLIALHVLQIIWPA